MGMPGPRLPTKKEALAFKAVLIDKIGHGSEHSFKHADPHATYQKEVVPDAHRMQAGQFTDYLFASRRDHVYGSCPDYMDPRTLRECLGVAFAKILIAEGVDKKTVLEKMTKYIEKGI